MRNRKKVAWIITFFILISGADAFTSAENSDSYEKVDALVMEKDFAGARIMLEKMIKEDSSDYVAIAALGNVYMAEGNKKKALQFLRRSIKINPDYPLSHFLLGRLYFLMQEEEGAVEEFNLFRLKSSPFSGMMGNEEKELHLARLQYICEAYFYMKLSGEYKNVIDEMLAIDPKNQTAVYNLGVYYYVFEHSRSRAYESFKRAEELDPKTYMGKKANYAIDYIRNNPDSRVAPDFSFIDRE